MKKTIFLFCSFIAVFLLMSQSLSAQNLNGAWSLNGNKHQILMIQDGYFSWTQTSPESTFINTLGGRVSVNGKYLDIKLEFNAEDKYLVGESFNIPFELKGDRLDTRHPEGHALTWHKIKEEDQGLAGLWRITGRESDGKMNPIGRSARVTYKLLTAAHFQWMAINTDTGEFFGTGGGSYTFKDGKYTEHIEFFSRDNSRVGASLEFNGELKDGDWHHSGKSSTGNPIYEIWSKEKF